MVVVCGTAGLFRFKTDRLGVDVLWYFTGYASAEYLCSTSLNMHHVKVCLGGKYM